MIPPIVIVAATLAALAGIWAEFSAQRPATSAAGTAVATGTFLILAAVVRDFEFAALYTVTAVLLGVLGVGAVLDARRTSRRSRTQIDRDSSAYMRHEIAFENITGDYPEAGR